MKFIINEELLGAIINYLASKPYIETFKLIGQLNGLQKLEEKEEKKDG